MSESRPSPPILTPVTWLFEPSRRTRWLAPGRGARVTQSPMSDLQNREIKRVRAQPYLTSTTYGHSPQLRLEALEDHKGSLSAGAMLWKSFAAQSR